MHEVVFHYAEGKQLKFSLSDDELAYLSTLLDSDAKIKWLKLPEEWVNLSEVRLITVE